MAPNLREIYVESIQALADRLAPEGFKLVRRSGWAKRQRQDTLDIVYFQSSHNNSSAGQVVLRVGVNSRNRHLAEWRRSAGTALRRDDWVTGHYLSYLEPRGTLREWNLFDHQKRAAVLTEVAALIEMRAIPWFYLVSDIEQLEYTAPELDIVANPGSLVELLLAYGRRDAVPALMARWHAVAAPLHLAEFERATKLVKSGARSTGPNTVHDLASVLVGHGFVD